MRRGREKIDRSGSDVTTVYAFMQTRLGMMDPQATPEWHPRVCTHNTQAQHTSTTHMHNTQAQLPIRFICFSLHLCEELCTGRGGHAAVAEVAFGADCQL